MAKSRLTGWGHSLPTSRLTNEELSESLGIPAEEIFQKTGIRARAIAHDETVIDLALKASLEALDRSGLTPADLDVIVFALSVPAQPMPATANLLQKAIGGSCMCFDLNAACTGFKYGLTVVDGLIQSGFAKHALVVGADLGSRMVDYTKTGPSIIFADGAGAFIFSASVSDDGILSHVNRTQSSFAQDLAIKVGGSLKPYSIANAHSEERFMKMNGPRVFAQAVSEMSALCLEVCEKADVAIETVNWIIPHQANYRILEAVGWKLPIPSERIIVDLEDIGNTAAATLPIAFSRAYQSGKIKKGDLVLFVSFAAGFSGGATLMRVS